MNIVRKWCTPRLEIGGTLNRALSSPSTRDKTLELEWNQQEQWVESGLCRSSRTGKKEKDTIFRIHTWNVRPNQYQCNLLPSVNPSLPTPLSCSTPDLQEPPMQAPHKRSTEDVGKESACRTHPLTRRGRRAVVTCGNGRMAVSNGHRRPLLASLLLYPPTESTRTVASPR